MKNVPKKNIKQMKNKKAQLRSKCDMAWYNKCLLRYCEVCEKPAQQVHHFFPKGQFGHLRYNTDNGISLCNGCHFAHHSKGDPRIHQTIIKNRGIEWYNELLNESRKNPASYQTIGYYKDKLKELE